jgi:hypothetical protein
MCKLDLIVGLKIQNLILFSVEIVVTERSCVFFRKCIYKIMRPFVFGYYYYYYYYYYY